MNADEIVKVLKGYSLPFLAYKTDSHTAQAIYDAADLIESLQEEVGAAHTREDAAYAALAEAQARERAFEVATKRHYADMTSQCFICYSCINYDAHERAHWDGKKLTEYACAGCGGGKPNWQFDVDRFAGRTHNDDIRARTNA